MVGVVFEERERAITYDELLKNFIVCVRYVDYTVQRLEERCRPRSPTRCAFEHSSNQNDLLIMSPPCFPPRPSVLTERRLYKR
jgi:hypothetical protein